MTGVEVGLTGGIGSGKSTVSQQLEKLGAKLVDADLIVRELQEPGQPVFLGMVDYFGEDILLSDGTLNRQAIADVVFKDAKELEALNKLVHPTLQDEMERRRKDYLDAEEKVIVDFPLLVESKYEGFEHVIVVDCDPNLAIERLVSERGFKREDAMARVKKQATREERLAVADFVIENDSDVKTLMAQVDKCWKWICSLA